MVDIEWLRLERNCQDLKRDYGVVMWLLGIAGGHPFVNTASCIVYNI